MPLRLVHFADLHLGVTRGGRRSPSSGLNQRIDDVCARLDEVCDVVEQEEVHAVLFAGDAFANQRPDPTLQSLFATRIRRMARAGAGVFLLIGNHDLPRSTVQVHPFSIYAALEVAGVVVGDRARVYRLPLGEGAPAPELQVAALPHFSRQAVLARLPDETEDPDRVIQDQITQTVRELGTQVDPSAPAVFVGHCHVAQADVGGAGRLFDVSDIEVALSTLTTGQPFPYYALGHLHRSQVLAADPFVTYSGSLERVDFGEGERIDIGADGSVRRREAEPKGFYRLDVVTRDGKWTLESEPDFRTVDARPFVTLRVGDLDATEPAEDLERRFRAVRSHGVLLDGAFVRVTGAVSDPSSRRRVTATATRDLAPEAYDVELDLVTHEATTVRDPRFARAMTPTDALDRYLETRDDWAEDREALIKLGRELIREVVA